MISVGTDRRRYLADFSLLLITVVWGLSFTILKSIMGDQFSPVILVLLRFFVASLVILPFSLGGLGKLDRGGVIGSVILGALLFFGFSTQSIGIQFTTASRSAFITGLSALFVPLFLFSHKRKSPGLVNGLAILGAIIGMYLLTDPAGGGFNKGDILTLICSSIFGAHIYVMGVVVPGRNFLSITLIQLATTTLLAALFLPIERLKFQINMTSAQGIIFLAVFATAAALLVQAWAQQRTSAVKAGLIFTAEPLFAYLFASAILGDYFNPIQKIGGAIIVLAVVASEIAPLLLTRKKG